MKIRLPNDAACARSSDTLASSGKMIYDRCENGRADKARPKKADEGMYQFMAIGR